MTEPASDKDIPRILVERAKRGDPAALEELIRALYPLVARWSVVKTGDADDAQDVTQEVMIRISRYIGRFRERSSITTWAYQITSNAAIDHHRRGRRKARVEVPEDEPSAGEGAMEPEVDRLDDAAVRDLVSAFFAQLPERQREVFALVDLQGFKASEAAEMLGLNAVTVRGHLFRARRFVRRKILETHPELVEEYIG